MKKQLREVRVIDLFTYFGLSFVILVTIWVSFVLLLLNTRINIFILLAVAIPLTYFVLRYFLIGLVLMYKAFAPLSTRDRCRFEPTCSTYMILSIKRYGVFRGVIKGIKRILRCKPPNGGIDYP